MLSRGLIGVWQPGHADAGATIDCPIGTRWIKTFKKEPIRSPRNPQATAADHIGAF